MRAPFQSGDFPGPVKYGYLSVGVVEQGPAALVGRAVFCLHPHQDRFVVPARRVDADPRRRATSSCDAGRRSRDSGQCSSGMPALGSATGRRRGCRDDRMRGRRPAAHLPVAAVATRGRRPRAPGGRDESRGGVRRPAEAPADCDVVIHASATSAGLQRSLELLGDEGEVIELSWYGANEVSLPLGCVFHPRRLSIRASQVGEVAASRRARRTRADRLALALDLLRDDAFDALDQRLQSLCRTPDTMRLRRRRTAGALPRHRLLRRDDMYAVTVRDHVMIAHSLPRPVFGPAQGLHGATYVVEATFRRRELDDGCDRGRHRAATSALAEVLARLRYQNLDDLPDFDGVVTTTEVLTAGSRTASPSRRSRMVSTVSKWCYVNRRTRGRPTRASYETALRRPSRRCLTDRRQRLRPGRRRGVQRGGVVVDLVPPSPRLAAALKQPWAGAHLVDGLLACAQPEVVEAESVGVLVHMPLAWQSG